jgi:hypothetical protein
MWRATVKEEADLFFVDPRVQKPWKICMQVALCAHNKYFSELKKNRGWGFS